MTRPAQPKPQAWTAEPWDVIDASIVQFDSEGREWSIAEAMYDIGYGDTEANAARIVSCVNALAGIDKPAEWRLLVTTATEARRWWIASSHDPRIQNAAMRKMVEAVDALLALQPPNEEETSDG